MSYKRISPQPVSESGTGVTTMTTAYAPVCAGTTATGALQVASTGIGTAGFVLTSTGASSLPSFQAAAGGGITAITGDNTTSLSGPSVLISASGTGGVFNANAGTQTSTLQFNYLNTVNSTVVGNAANGQLKDGSSRIFWSDGASNLYAGKGSGSTATPQFAHQTGNTGIGANALHAILGGTTSVTNNTGVGASSLTSITSGGGNSCLGTVTFAGVTTGSNNIGIGSGTGQNNTTNDSNNIYLNNNGNSGENNTLRIGASTGSGGNQLNASFIAGIQGITVTGTAVLVSSSDQLGVAVSSARFKDNIQDMGDYSSNILKLRPTTFNYTVGEDNSMQGGLIAEEVQEVMPSLVVLDKEGLPQTVKYHDLPALILNELQKALKRIDILENKLSSR